MNSSLTSKRLVSYNNKINDKHIIKSLDSIDKSNDDVENKLDSMINNTNLLTLNGVLNFSFTGNDSHESPVIDIGVASKGIHFNWVGTKDSSFLSYTLKVSSDNITFFNLANGLFIISGNHVESKYKMNFRYHKLTVINSNPSVATSTLHYAGRS